jgi:hypothetical protein
MVSYNREFEICLVLIQALETIVDFLEENPSEYPMLMSDIVTLLYGRKVRLTNGQTALCNGLDDQIREMYETLDALQLEVNWGGENDAIQTGGDDSVPCD